MFEIKQLTAGARSATHKRPENFSGEYPRKSAALAALIDYAISIGASIIHEDDPAYPECVDVLLCLDTSSYQYTIQPVGFKL